MYRDNSNSAKDGQIYVSAEELQPSREHFKFRVNFNNLPSIQSLKKYIFSICEDFRKTQEIHKILKFP